MNDVDNEAYWKDRHEHLEGSLSSVGVIGISETINRQLYARKKRRLADIMRKLGHLDLEGKTVLDAGCGIGIMSELFFSLGATVSGVDTSPIAIKEAIDRASPRHYPAGKFVVGSVIDFNFDMSFDFTFCLDVMYHIMSDKNWTLTLENLVKHTKPGGHLIIIDQLKTEVTSPAPHVRFRSRDMYHSFFTKTKVNQIPSSDNNILIYQL